MSFDICTNLKKSAKVKLLKRKCFILAFRMFFVLIRADTVVRFLKYVQSQNVMLESLGSKHSG